MLFPSKTQEWLSEAHFKTITTMVGLNIARDDADFGFDAYLSEPWQQNGRYFPGTKFLAVQLKSVVGAKIDDDEVHYRLKLRAYDILRDTAFSFPALLVLFVLPPDNQKLWVSSSEHGMTINASAYWHSLKGAPQHKPDGQPANTTVPIAIPRHQQFTVAGLLHIWQQFNTDLDFSAPRSPK